MSDTCLKNKSLLNRVVTAASFSQPDLINQAEFQNTQHACASLLDIGLGCGLSRVKGLYVGSNGGKRRHVGFLVSLPAWQHVDSFVNCNA